MHPYATDSQGRETVHLMTAATSILAAYVLSGLLGVVKLEWLQWVDVPSVLGFYKLFNTIFDKWLWRSEFLHRIGLIKVPDLAGSWRGHLTSSYTNHTKGHEVEIEIKQTWTRLAIIFKTGTSRSHSHAGTILVENPGGVLLAYEYTNEPQPDALTTMGTHRGTAHLTLKKIDGHSVLEGGYYTGRGRQTFGTLQVEFTTTR